MKMKILLTISFVFLVGSCLFANNIATANVKLTGQNTSNHTTQVQFDISWENSWRTSSGPGNWDAAWVFVKYRVNSTGPWQHAYLNSGGHAAPNGSTITVGLLTPANGFNATTNPGMGTFIYRSANGSGTFSLTGVQLQWNYGANGVQDNDLVDVQVYAIEQVYVPSSSFYLGSGAGSSAAFEYGSFYTYPTEATPFQVMGEGAITVGPSATNLYYGVGGGDQAGPIPAAYPKGYAAFYCMKYELSQLGYAEFLNSLSYAQSHARYDYNGSIGRNRYAIDTIVGNSTFISRAPYIACNFLNWADLSAYLDWAGLRPITELEYEKACRGTLTPVPNENAWGTASTTNHYYTISNRDATNELISSELNTYSGVGNVSCFQTVASSVSPTPGPLRVGIFAASAVGEANVGRSTVGATYYGIMEMSGNVYERAVSAGNAQGRAFAGSHGNGTLDAAGNATNADWPSPTTAVGVALRGGGFNTPNSVDSLSVSNRRFATLSNATRSAYWGGRGGRTAQ